MKVLIGEARPSLDAYTLQGLMAAGHDVRRSHIGAELLFQLQQGSYDVVILGEEARDQMGIERIRTAGMRTPVLLLEDSEMMDVSLLGEHTECLVKPFSLSRLLACMNRLADKKLAY
ncbi:hypothetical protein ACKC9G_04080 [Pokkaliibacter sp. CJK22405]|uniref:hypothetical protein n=1 Tax=Pokkaliibacter sp. CJK22405 TaxID=3384615 RepID=UPI0039856A80